MDTAQWLQGIVVRPIEEIVTNTCPKPNSSSSSSAHNNNLERKLTRPQKESALNCPRCNSTNTKFCYYNNSSLTQPRYFCKTCRRYWTDGGSLRNIPVGGGSRKNKRASLSSSSNNSSSTSSITSSTPRSSSNLSHKRLPDLMQPNNQNQDLNLGFLPSNQVFTHHQGLDQNSVKNKSLSTSSVTTTTTTTTTSHLSAMELLNGLTNRGSSLNSFLPSSDPNNGGSFFPMSDLMIKPSLNFSLEGIGSGYGSGGMQGQHGQENNGRLLFPFEDLKQGSDGGFDDHNNKEQLNNGGDSNGYWSGMLGGGSW